jgi:hypothetical protein
MQGKLLDAQPLEQVGEVVCDDGVDVRIRGTSSMFGAVCLHSPITGNS